MVSPIKSPRLRFHLSFLLITALCGCVGCGHSPPGPKDNFGRGIEDTRLGAGDKISVTVVHEKELSGRYRVSALGTIKFPLVGLVKIAGLTSAEAAKKLEGKLRDGYLKNPQILIYVDAYQSKKIHVFGSVRKPGTFNYLNNMSIIEAITLAGGFTPLASKNKTTVTRNEKGKKQRFTLAVDDIGRGTASNYFLQPGDVVFVPERVF